MPTMPRKATPQDANVPKIIARIKGFCANESTSTLALSRAAGVSQPSLFRFLNGERKTITATARKVIEHIDTRHNWHNWHSDAIIKNSHAMDHAGYSLIQDAVMSLWDGDRRSAELLASLIKALKPAIELVATANKDSSGRG